MGKYKKCASCKHNTKEKSELPCCACVDFGIDFYKPKTNADRIRNMTDEELAVYTCEIQQLAIDRNKADKVEDALQWLQAEVKEGNSNENT